MAVSTVVAVSAGISHETNRKARSAQKRADKKAEREAAAEKKRQTTIEAAEKKKEERLAAAKSKGTEATRRIAAERSYLRRGRRGRTSTIKGGSMLG